jgi:dihydrodipicolinate synthase/N-acetylneuraminate lyase
MTAQVNEEWFPLFSLASALIETPLQACSCVEEVVPAFLIGSGAHRDAATGLFMGGRGGSGVLMLVFVGACL